MYGVRRLIAVTAVLLLGIIVGRIGFVPSVIVGWLSIMNCLVVSDEKTYERSVENGENE